MAAPAISSASASTTAAAAVSKGCRCTPVTCRTRRVAVSALGERQGGGEQLLELVRRLGRVDVGERAHLVEELR